MLRANAKHIRHIEFHIRVETNVNLKFSEKDGISCLFDHRIGEISMEVEDMLDEHSRAIESTRKALNPKGGALVMAALSNWSLWETLQDEVVDPEDSDWE